MAYVDTSPTQEGLEGQITAARRAYEAAGRRLGEAKARYAAAVLAEEHPGCGCALFMVSDSGDPNAEYPRAVRVERITDHSGAEIWNADTGDDEVIEIHYEAEGYLAGALVAMDATNATGGTLDLRSGTLVALTYDD